MLKRAKELERQMVEWRRDFHMYPELGFGEARTAAKVAKVLRGLGYAVRTGVGVTGVVAERGKGEPIIAVRADMDALPIQEENQVPYASKVPGVMHACGHDAHMAIGLATATIMAKETFPGTIRFLFQPAEEVSDKDGKSGAPRMLEAGVLDGVNSVLALHVDSTVETGVVDIEYGPACAGVDTFHLVISGRGGHAAEPHEAIDPIFIASHVLLAIYGIVARRVNPIEPAVVGVGSIHGGRTDNVIPERVRMSGTIRYMNTNMQARIHSELKQAVEIARTMGGACDLKIEIGSPPMVNDEAVSELVEEVAIEMLGPKQIKHSPPAMGAEDFCFFSAKVPGTMFTLGCRIEGDVRRHHSPRFDVDERCLPIGAAVMTESALRLLRQGGVIVPGEEGEAVTEKEAVPADPPPKAPV
jgi:amidohydrolase